MFIRIGSLVICTDQILSIEALMTKEGPTAKVTTRDGKAFYQKFNTLEEIYPILSTVSTMRSRPF